MLIKQLLALKAVQPVEETVNPDLTGDRYPEGSADFEDAVSTTREHLTDALTVITAAAWDDWMEATDSNFHRADAVSKSEEIVEKLKELIADFDALYDHMAEISED